MSNLEASKRRLTHNCEEEKCFVFNCSMRKRMKLLKWAEESDDDQDLSGFILQIIKTTQQPNLLKAHAICALLNDKNWYNHFFNNIDEEENKMWCQYVTNALIKQRFKIDCKVWDSQESENSYCAEIQEFILSPNTFEEVLTFIHNYGHNEYYVYPLPVKTTDIQKL